MVIVHKPKKMMEIGLKLVYFVLFVYIFIGYGGGQYSILFSTKINIASNILRKSHNPTAQESKYI
jgi:hypothetical protein